MPHFRTRRFQPADEEALNACYNAVIKSHFAGERSLELMRWLWYAAPGSPMDSWLVEAQNDDGSWKIIGHHGLCPVRFTCGSQDILCAKTASSFLLPEFRSQFLYIRFEKECLAETRSRYNTTYSRGSGTLRLRKSIGYGGEDTWILLEHGARHLDFATRLFARFVKKFPHEPWVRIARTWANVCSLTATRSSFDWIEYDSEQAIQSPFFVDFWQQARGEAGMSPRRDVADLAWRFWKRPDSTFTTLVHSSRSGERAFCVVETSNPFMYHLADIFVTPMRPEFLAVTLDALFNWCLQRGALTITFRTTRLGQPPDLMQVFLERMHLHPLAGFRHSEQFCYRPFAGTPSDVNPRKWNVTDLLVPA